MSVWRADQRRISSVSFIAGIVRWRSRKFLDRIEAEVPAELDVHLILDNYGTHKTATIQRWLDSVARFCQRTLETGH